MNTGQVRRAGTTDLSALLALYAHLHPQEPTPPLDSAKKPWTEILGSADIAVFVIETSDGTLVASCTLALVPNLTRGARPFGVIENVVTHSEYRQRGYGSKVLRAAVEAAEGAGCYKVCLATGSRREETLRFYEGVGFKRDAKTYFEVRRL
jgi:ribosomal protein S18 acetylase RimI-like enzyme